MVEKVIIKNNRNTPIHYLKDLESFKNGTEFTFKKGVNIIVGENGCGKTTLLKLIRKYLLLHDTKCSIGEYHSNISTLFGMNNNFCEGAEVYADYKRNSFRLVHAGERTADESMSSFEKFGEMVQQKHASTGESVMIALGALFNDLFSEGAELTFDYEQFKDKKKYNDYYEYTQNHMINGDEFTILMDEPDRNLSLENMKQISGILSFHKPDTQIIAVIHNPLLIYNLSNNKDVNVIEMTNGYVKKVRKEVEELLNK